MAASQPANFNVQEFTDAGLLLAGGRLYTYINGTTTQKIAYTDAAGTIPQTYTADGLGGFYIALNARGELPTPLYLGSGSYDLSLKRADGSTVWTRRADGVDNAAVNGLAALSATYSASSGASLVGFIQSGAGAVAMTLQAAERERVSVKQFGATGDGVTDDTAAVQAAITYACSGNVKTLEWPNGIYKITSSLLIPATGSGLVMRGQSSQGAYIYTAAGTFDLLKVAASYCTIEGLLFRPGGNQYPIRIYAAHCTLQGNRFLAATAGVGTGVFITDVDPDTSLPVAGAYTHNIVNNVIGVAGYEFAIGIDCSSTNGIQACKFVRNDILSDRCIVMPRGGANVYIGNKLQSKTGGGVGIGIDIGADASGEKIVPGNYFENFEHATLIRQLSNTNAVMHNTGSHNDAVTNKITTLGATNFVFENDGGTMYTNGWVKNYSSSAIQRWQTPSGTEGFALTSGALFFVNATSGANHIINTTGAIEAALILTLQGGGNSASFFRHVTGTAANGANTALSLRANSVTSRSINAGGTINASGADYAEYMRKSRACFDLVKGQIVGTDSNGELTDKLENAVHYFVKSTNPSLVGGDDWDDEPQPDAPGEPTEPRRPVPPFHPTAPERPPYFINDEHEQAFDAELATYQADMLAYGDLKAAFDVDMWKYDAALSEYQAALLAHPGKVAAYEKAMTAWDAQHEAKRAQVDRIAFCGQVPVNVYGAKPGDWILPDGGGTAWDMLNDPEVPEWFKKAHRSVGKVLSIEQDGRARILVKVL